MLDFSPWSFIVLAAVLLPNVFYMIFPPADKFKPAPAKPVWQWLERVGRMGCMILMAFDIGPFRFGFADVGPAIAWMVLMCALVGGYWAMWICYFINKRRFFLWTLLPMAVLPSLVFLLTGALCFNPALLLFAALFAAGHILVTCDMRRQMREARAAAGEKCGKKA